MSTTMSSAAALKGGAKAKKKDTGHRIRVWIAALACAFLVTGLALYGANYYLLPLDQRPYSDKYEILKPGGSIGLKLGICGTLLFFIIFLYAFRKIVPWLGRMGTARQWMDFHVIAGLTAPVVIAFHASFKFRGIAGAAFWIMVLVALSGVVGRYLYAQIHGSLGAANLSLKELEETERELRELTDALSTQAIFSSDLLDRVFAIPTPEKVRSRGMLRSIGAMLWIDLCRPFQAAYLRRAAARASGERAWLGLFSSGHFEVEEVVRLAKEKASLSKRMLFLEKAQKVFHLWHVVHRPFSYGFALLAIVHILVVSGLGFFTIGMR